MKEVILKYDETTGEIYDMDGYPVAIPCFELNYKELSEVEHKTQLDDVTKLRAMGMSVEDIVALKDAGLL